MADFIHQDFLSRLKHVSGGRYVTAWLKGLGLSGSVVTGLSRGNIPKGQTLMHLLCMENVNASWLLTGEGNPYLVEVAASDTDARARINDALKSPGWAVVMATDKLNHALIFMGPARFVLEDKPPRPYTAVTVLANPGPEALMALTASAGDVRSLLVSEARFQDLTLGRLGSYQLLGDRASPGLLAKAQPLQAAMAETIAEHAARYNAGPTGEAISPDEAALLGKYRGLSQADRTRVQTIVDALAAAVRDAEASD